MAWNQSRPIYRRPRKAHRPAVPMLLSGLLFASAAGVGVTSGGVSLDSVRAMLPGSGCNIKGNISVNTGESIYHMPGQEYYDATRISPEHGERWFCSEEEARHAGWRKALTR